MKVSELEGAVLDYWVARANGMSSETADVVRQVANYSTNWMAAGPIIEREGMWITRWPDGKWSADIPGHPHYSRGIPMYQPPHVVATGYGTNALTAAMRCFVASRFGENTPNAEVPDA